MEFFFTLGYYSQLNENFIPVVQEVLNSVAEKGPYFTLKEYEQLIELYHRSFSGNPVSVQDARRQRLYSIMEKGQNETV